MCLEIEHDVLQKPQTRQTLEQIRLNDGESIVSQFPRDGMAMAMVNGMGMVNGFGMEMEMDIETEITELEDSKDFLMCLHQ